MSKGVVILVAPVATASPIERAAVDSALLRCLQAHWTPLALWRCLGGVLSDSDPRERARALEASRAMIATLAESHARAWDCDEARWSGPPSTHIRLLVVGDRITEGMAIDLDAWAEFGWTPTSWAELEA